MPLDGGGRDRQLVGGLSIGEPPRDQRRDLALTRAERRGGRAASISVSAAAATPRDGRAPWMTLWSRKPLSAPVSR